MTDHKERTQQRIDWIMQDRIHRAFEQILEDIIDERYSRDDAWVALGNWDMDDYFADWWAEDDELA